VVVLKFKELVMAQDLSDVDLAFCNHTCKQWERFSNTVGRLNKKQTLKVLKYLLKERPNSKSFGQRAVRRFNHLNKVRWEDLN